MTHPPRPLFSRLGAALIALASSIPGGAGADDWPHWRGPHRDGISRESGWSAEFRDGEPAVAWRREVGTGFSSVAVAGGRVFTLGNEADTETVWCLDAHTGEVVWRFDYRCPLDPKYFEGGPTSTPAFDAASDTVFTLSRRGDLIALDRASGELRWRRNVASEHEMPVPTWGFAGSPLVLGDRLVLNVGEAGMAVAKRDGSLVWASAPAEAGYSTPLPLARGGREVVLLGCQKSWRAVAAADGAELWSERWLTRYGVNAADPVVRGEHILISSGYGKGSALLEWGGAPDDPPELVWKNKLVRSQMNPGVLVGDHLYAIDGDAGNDNALKCLEFATGDELWSVPNVGTGGVTAADGKLIVLSARGELIIAPASPAGFAPIARAQVLGGKCWTVPVLSGGRLYARNAAGDLACIDLREARP